MIKKLIKVAAFAFVGLAALGALMRWAGRENQDAEPAAAITPISVCQAARAAVGQHVAVTGEFDGFGYATNSKRVTLITSELCNTRGAGVVYAELTNEAEARKPQVYNAHPQDTRRGKAGDTVTVEGIVEKVEEGRFTHLRRAQVR